MNDTPVVVLEVGEKNGTLRVGNGVDEENEGIAEEERKLCGEQPLSCAAQHVLGVGGDSR